MAVNIRAKYHHQVLSHDEIIWRQNEHESSYFISISDITSYELLTLRVQRYVSYYRQLMALLINVSFWKLARSVVKIPMLKAYQMWWMDKIPPINPRW